jgi:hypothetical protein
MERVAVQCMHCRATFCATECALKAATFLRYRDTNYIFGTQLDFTLWRESHAVTNANGQTLFQMSDMSVLQIFNAVKLSDFHKRTDADRPEFGDQPYRVIEYGRNYVASMDNDVPELAQLMLMLYEQYKEAKEHPVDYRHQTRMRVQTSMK